MNQIAGLLLVVLLAMNFAGQAQDKKGFVKLYDEASADSLYKGAVSVEDIKALPLFQGQHVLDMSGDVAELLEKRLPQYDIICFLGTWCEDSQAWVPDFFSMLELGHYPAEKLKLFAVDRSKEALNDEKQQYDIQFVPTFIFLKNGKEVGRIVESPASTMADALVDILGKDK